MRAFAYDQNGRFVGEVECQIDPLESKEMGEDIYLTPAHATLYAPPFTSEEEIAVWNGETWSVEPKPVIIDVTPIAEEESDV